MHHARWKRHGNPLTKLNGNGYTDGHGYKMRSINGQEVREQRFIMEQHLERQLSADEIVHHINENKLDNRIENLGILTRSEHAKLHHEKGFKLHPATKTNTHRWCGACKEVKPVEEFQICTRNRSGVQSQCKKCRIQICHDSYQRKQFKLSGRLSP